MSNLESVLRQLPAVERILQSPAVARLVEQHGRRIVLQLTQELLEDVRSRCRSGEVVEAPALDALVSALQTRIEAQMRPSLTPVINATGVVLHTNIGRAPLSQAMIDFVGRTSRNYTNLEYDLAEGKRGHRDRHLARLLQRLLGCQDATVVNNNAAALFLILNTLAASREVLVSRGELIEIGGSFRIPDIMKSSGALLREVGTTNKTRLSDYERNIGAQTALILRVHPSNYRVIGFTERPELEQLVELGKKHSIPVVEDLGSGCIDEVANFGSAQEPTVRDSLAGGVTLACFSGDKMLGGPQAGVIVGQADAVARLRSNPLMRVLRLDKITSSLLEFVFLSYLRGTARQELPVLQMLGASRDEIHKRSAAFSQRLREAIPLALDVELKDGYSVTGGGSAPQVQLPTVLVTVLSQRRSTSRLEAALRGSQPPVLARIEENRLCLDLRTVLPEQESQLIDAFRKIESEPPA